MNKHRHFTKKASAITAALIIFALTLTGTLAWYASANAENIFSGSKQSDLPDPELHDDFDEGSGMKNVYVENTGENAIFVRVKFNEFLDLEHSTKPEGELVWETHMPALGSDGLYHHEYDDCHTLYEGHKYFSWVWGNDKGANGQRWYLPSALQPEENVFTGYVTDKTPPADYENDPDARLTYPAQIISMDSYQLWSPSVKAAYMGWIYDITDGWAYWSQPLPPNEATGLLLAWVDTDTEALDNTNYCYIIDVIMDAVDAEDLDLWLSGADPDKSAPASTAAAAILNTIKDYALPASPNA